MKSEKSHMLSDKQIAMIAEEFSKLVMDRLGKKRAHQKKEVIKQIAHAVIEHFNVGFDDPDGKITGDWLKSKPFLFRQVCEATRLRLVQKGLQYT